MLSSKNENQILTKYIQIWYIEYDNILQLIHELGRDYRKEC